MDCGTWPSRTSWVVETHKIILCRRRSSLSISDCRRPPRDRSTPWATCRRRRPCAIGPHATCCRPAVYWASPVRVRSFWPVMANTCSDKRFCSANTCRSPGRYSSLPLGQSEAGWGCSWGLDPFPKCLNFFPKVQ